MLSAYVLQAFQALAKYSLEKRVYVLYDGRLQFVRAAADRLTGSKVSKAICRIGSAYLASLFLYLKISPFQLAAVLVPLLFPR